MMRGGRASVTVLVHPGRGAAVVGQAGGWAVNRHGDRRRTETVRLDSESGSGSELDGRDARPGPGGGGQDAGVRAVKGLGQEGCATVAQLGGCLSWPGWAGCTTQHHH